jgi:hypothetical protein
LGSGIRGSFGLVSIVTPENEFCKNLMSQDTITTVDSEVYDSIGGHKHSLDQDTRWLYHGNPFQGKNADIRVRSKNSLMPGAGIITLTSIYPKLWDSSRSRNTHCQLHLCVVAASGKPYMTPSLPNRSGT